MASVIVIDEFIVQCICNKILSSMQVCFLKGGKSKLILPNVSTEQPSWKHGGILFFFTFSQILISALHDTVFRRSCSDSFLTQRLNSASANENSFKILMYYDCQLSMHNAKWRLVLPCKSHDFNYILASSYYRIEQLCIVSGFVFLIYC